MYCPVCSKKGIIEISEKPLVNATRGLISISISKDIVCEHAFIAYVDKNLKVRDYFRPDFQLDLRSLRSAEPTEKEEEPPLSKPPMTEESTIEKDNAVPSIPPGCKAGDFIEMEYEKDIFLGYIFNVENNEGTKELMSLSMLLSQDQDLEVYKLVIKEFIEELEQNGLLKEKVFTNNQESIFQSFNLEKNLEIEQISIPLSRIFKKKRRLCNKQKLNPKGKFF